LAAIVARPEFTDWAMAGNTGTRMPRANWQHVATMPVAVPPPDRRPALDASLNDLWKTGLALTKENADLTRARDELLPLLLSGRIRVAETVRPG
jgi:type I restriction enzyme S subunit